MGFQDYRPTHRETEVLELIETAPTETVSRAYIHTHTGATPGVVDEALENLEMLGHVKQVGKNEYEPLGAPMDSVFDN